MSRDAEGSRLTERLLTAEQDERRRLALFLHDGPVQTLAAVALMLDHVRHAIDDGNAEDAQRVLADALDLHRTAIKSLRDLSFDLEPVVLRDQGIATAVAALAEEVGLERKVQVDVDVAAAEQLDEQVQAALYQIIRESFNSAVARRPPPTRIRVAVSRDAAGNFVTEIVDDGGAERRLAFFDTLSDRARTLDGHVAFEQGEGTRIVVELPPAAVAKRSG